MNPWKGLCTVSPRREWRWWDETLRVLVEDGRRTSGRMSTQGREMAHSRDRCEADRVIRSPRQDVEAV